jgi:hypothetical protein
MLFFVISIQMNKDIVIKYWIDENEFSGDSIKLEYNPF